MLRFSRIPYAPIALLATMTVLGACQLTPTSTPTPPPTATPEPTSIERLAWFETRPDAAHWIAWVAIRRMTTEDEPLTQQIASLGWVVDGITPAEAGVLDDLSWLLRENPAIVDTALNLPWMATNGSITPKDRRGLRAIRATADIDADLVTNLISYQWIVDGISELEAQTLEAFANSVVPKFRENTVTGIGATRIPFSDIDAPPPGTLPLVQSFAEYHWLQDDIEPQEPEALRQLVAAVSHPEPTLPGFLEQLTQVSWLRDNVDSVEIAAIVEWSKLGRNAQKTGTPAGRTVWEYDWAQDDATPAETAFLANLNELIETAGSLHADAVDTVASYDWVENGIREADSNSLPYFGPLFESAGMEDTEALRIILAYEWVEDGLMFVEASDVGRLASILDASSSDDGELMRTILSYPWLADSIDGSEYSVVNELPDFLRLEEAEGTQYRQSVLRYDWLRDDITFDEAVAIRFLFNSVEPLLAESSYVLDSLLAYEWLRDGVRADESPAIQTLITITDQYGVGTDDFIDALLTRPWLKDELQHQEIQLLSSYSTYLTYNHTPEVTVPSHLAAYPWLDDGISDIEFDYVLAALYLLRDVSPIAPETAVAVIERSDADPTSLQSVRSAFRRLRDVVRVSNSLYDRELTQTVATMPWLLDGIEQFESRWLSEYGWLLREFNGENHELARSVLDRPWARDSITPDEIEWTHQFRRLLEITDGETREISLSLGNAAWFQQEIGGLEASVIGRLGQLALNGDTTIIENNLFGDTSSDSGLVLLLAFLDAQARSRYQYQDLLEQNHIAERTLQLPLAGDVGLYVVRHTEFPEDDPTLDLMEQITIQLEDFMGVPFPRNPAVILIMEPSKRGGEEPQYYVAYAISTYIVASAPRYNPGFHLAVFHEMSHLYWGGHTGAPPWWTEGAAGFLPDIARDALGHETLEERHHQLLWDTRNECWHRGVRDISTYYHLQSTQPQVARDRGICVYALGEIFLVEMYLLLGHDATSAAMRQIYVDARDSGWLDPITDQQIYDAFRANTPDDKLEEFRKLFLRLHGGARVTFEELPTT